MQIDNEIIRHYLKKVLFINETAYAGKSTMVKMLAGTYGLIHCGENYDCAPKELLIPDKYPNLCYFDTMKDWQEFIGRTPEEYDDWIQGNIRELIQFEITYLMSVSHSGKIIVDTNLPVHVLKEIAGYNQVALMLAPPWMSVKHFFERDDPDKVFIREQITKSKDPEKAMANQIAILERINSQEYYDDFVRSGFFTIIRKDTVTDTRIETMKILAKHFGLE